MIGPDLTFRCLYTNMNKTGNIFTLPRIRKVHSHFMNKHTSRTIRITLACLLLLIAALFAVVIIHWDRIHPILSELEPQTEEPEDDHPPVQSSPAQTEESLSEAETQEPAQTVLAASPEEAIYTFLQGPRAWKGKVRWSGSWCNLELADSLFSVFGCGLCDLANIYSTLSPYECSPVDMFHYAVEHTEYAPGGGYGAIDWPYMRDVLRACGFTCKMRKKDKSYESFQKRIRRATTTIVLVSSYDDDAYWQDTPGHYVNIWLYDEETDKVFLADSGDPDHNRTWIPLRLIYDALGSNSPYQYLTASDYEEDKNTWKHNGITERWRKPSYYRSKSAAK